MDKFLREILQPHFERFPGFLSNDPSVVNSGNAKLSPAQRFLASHFNEGEGGGRKLFQGGPQKRCRYRGCRALLSVSNRYIYCRACLNRYSEDFVENNPLLNLTHALGKLRRDRKPRKQARRKRA